MPGLGKEGAYKDSTAPLRRCFSSGPRSSSDDGVKESTGEDPVAAALHFSDGEECRDSETDYDEECRNSGDYGEDHPGFTVILPHGAVWKTREYPDSVKVRVVVPSKMWKAKKLAMDMEWQYEEDEMGEKNLNIWIAEVDEITGEMKIEDMVADLGKYTPPKPSECIYFDAGRYEKDNMDGDIQNGVVTLTVPKIEKYKRWRAWRD